MQELSIGQTIAQLRKQAGMTQKELGTAVGVSVQAVSRWEHGGTPDIELLPRIAAVLGISTSTLLNEAADGPVDLEALIRRELHRLPQNQRLRFANQLAWMIMKDVTAELDPTGDSCYQYMTGSENADRRAPVPESVPSVVYVSHNTGIMQASVAADFPYTLFMPEPDDGYASIMKYAEDSRRFFAFLSKPHRVEALTFLYSMKPQQYFTVPFAAKQLHISEAEAQEIVDELYQNRIILRESVETPASEVSVYQRIQDTAWIPFLYFATETMRAQDVISALHLRTKPFFTSPLGTGCPSPRWRTRSDVEAEAPTSSHGCMDTI